MLMQYNTPMLQILNGSNNGLTEDDIAKADAFVSMLTENLHLINDCVLLRLPTFDITDKSKLKRYVTDEIGLEACQNEINLNIEMSVDPICVDLALYFFREFNKRLKNKYNYEFCSILSEDDGGCWIFRFHRIRGNGAMWINSDPDTYSDPVLYEVF